MTYLLPVIFPALALVVAWCCLWLAGVLED